MADVDIDPFGEHESRPEEPTDEHIPLSPVTPGRSSTWEPERSEQETLFGGESQRTKLMKDYIKRYQKTLVQLQKNFNMIISNSKVGNYTTEARESP